MNYARAIIGENYYRDRGSPILPIGNVNLTTFENQLFGTLWDGWPEGDGTNYLVTSRGGQMRVIHSSGSGVSGFGDGAVVRLIHDQTRRPIGDEWTVVGAFPHTKEAMTLLKSKSGKNALPFATFK